MDPSTEKLAEEGRSAFVGGSPLASNPYTASKHAPLTARLAALAWTWGWLFQEAEARRKMANQAVLDFDRARSAMTSAAVQMEASKLHRGGQGEPW